MLFYTSAYFKIKKMTTKIKVVQGGQGAGKNIGIALVLFEKAINGRKFITVATDTYDNLRDGSIRDFQNIFDAAGLDWQKYYNKNDNEIHIRGSVIQFRYVSDTRKSTGKSKRRDILYLNEANKIGWETASTYIGRTHEDVYLDYNPDFEFWAHTELPKLKDAAGNAMSSQIILTYLDNEMIPDAELNYILSRRDNTEWFRVYGMGQTGYYSERRILNYKFIDHIPDTAARIQSGLDFGVSPDPTWLGDLFVDKNNLYIDELFCMNNLMPEKINGAERMAVVDQFDYIGFPKGQEVIADSAGKTSIDDLKKHGYNVRGVHKHPGDQINGLNLLRGYNIFLTPRSVSIKKGIESFFWKVDRNGKIIPEPEGHEPDGIAGVRYVMQTHHRRTIKLTRRA